MGRINDYGQTLERPQREALSRRIAELERAGIELWYLASWRDPYGDPWRYAAGIAARWGLPRRAVLVVFVREGAWRAAGWRGEDARGSLPDGVWLDLLRRAEEDLRRHHPSRAILSLADALLDWLREGRIARERGGGLSPGAVAGIVLGALYLVVRLLREVHLRRRRGIM